MANTRTFNRSFAGGEMSPEMFGRIDDVKFQTGAARLRNFIATPQGPAENRPGFAFVRAVKDSTKRTRLIPFTYSTTQTMVIELGAGYIRFHTQGATLLSGGLPYEIANPYAEADLFDIHYVQSADVLTLVHPNYAPRELKRLGATNWTLTTIAFTPIISAPTSVTVTGSAGFTVDIAGITNAAPAVVTTVSNHGLIPGDSIYIKGVGGMTQFVDGFYAVESKPSDNTLTVKTYNGGVIVDSTAWGAYTSGGNIQFGDKVYDIDNYYVITSIAQNGVDESPASTSGSAVNNLYVTGAFNTITWPAVTGALRYNVYKRQSGLYGYIGQTQTTSFTDNNIAPDMGTTPPIYEVVFNGAGEYPGAVSYFEQRRAFAGTINSPQKLWMTRSGTESDMSYSLPVKDNDRIAFRVAAREANTIRHIVPLTQLILLTSSAEWRVSSINSDAITPTTISVRPQSYVGASNVQPEIINNSLVYCAARGGHVRELGYSWQSNGFITGDLSLRAAHLFDNHDIVDMAYSKAPRPLLWFVSNNGTLLGLTYVPEQQIGAWHWHDTDGTFESCAVVAEGNEDVLYVVVKRTVNGSSVRYVERMQTRQISTIENCFFVDSGATFNGTNATQITMSLTGGLNWQPSEVLTVVASAPAWSSTTTYVAGNYASFSGVIYKCILGNSNQTPPNATYWQVATPFVFPGTSDVNDAIVFTAPDGTIVRARILATTSVYQASVKVDKTVPVSLRGTQTTSWSFARNSVSGINWLEGKTVSVLVDGAVHPQCVVNGGTINLERAGTIITFGLQYDSDLQTLPLAINIDAFGQGRAKNINKAWLRVYQSSGIFIGPDEDNLTEAKQRTTEPYGSPPALKDAEIQVVLTPTWAQSGQVYVRQQDPLPLTIVGLTLEVSIGG